MVTLRQPLGFAERDRGAPRGFERALRRYEEIRGGHARERTDKCVRAMINSQASSPPCRRSRSAATKPRDYERVYELHVLGLEQTGTHVDSWAHGRDLSSPEALAATYLGDRGDFLVGELDGVIVAMGALRPFDDTRVEMKRVRVDPAHQRRGFGEAIVVRLEQRARELGASAVHLDTTTGQEPAIAMYREARLRGDRSRVAAALRHRVDGEAAQLTNAGASARHCSSGSCWIPRGVDHLHAHMVGAGVEVLLHPPRDRRFVTPRDDAVDEPVAPAVGRSLRR